MRELKVGSRGEHVHRTAVKRNPLISLTVEKGRDERREKIRKEVVNHKDTAYKKIVGFTTTTDLRNLHIFT